MDNLGILLIVIIALVLLWVYNRSRHEGFESNGHMPCHCGPNCKCGPNCSCRPGSTCGPLCRFHLYDGMINRHDSFHECPRKHGDNLLGGNLLSSPFGEDYHDHEQEDEEEEEEEQEQEQEQPVYDDELVHLTNIFEELNEASKNKKNYNTDCTKLTDATCRETEKVFKEFDNAAMILPAIGLPSQNNGVCTILHGMGPKSKKLKINGLESSSPLANAALFSTECTGGKSLNLYEMMLPEGHSPTPGAPSAAEAYAKELNNSGINVAGTHWHWWAADPYVHAIHHQNVGMDPVQFANKTTKALFNYRKRAQH